MLMWKWMCVSACVCSWGAACPSSQELQLFISLSLSPWKWVRVAALARAMRWIRAWGVTPSLFASVFPKLMHTHGDSLIARRRFGRRRSGLLSIQRLIAVVYELLRFNWTELKVCRFHLLSESWCVISVMGLDSFFLHPSDKISACSLLTTLMTASEDLRDVKKCASV